jgi:hypothetical protein
VDRLLTPHGKFCGNKRYLARLKKIWRSLHGIILLNCILANRRIGDGVACPICAQRVEDVCHLLFVFPAVKEVWQLLNLNDLVEEASHVDRSGSGYWNIS